MDLDAIEDGPIMPGFSGTLTPDEPLRTTREPAPAPEAEEETEEAPAEEAPAEEAPDEPLVPPAAPAAKLKLEDEEAEVEIDGETVKVKDLRQQRLAHAEFTRKSQEIARERDDHARYRLEAELKDIETADFLRRMDDPNELINEFAAHKPEVWEAVEDYIIQRAIHLQGLTPEGRQLFLRDEADKRKAWQAGRQKAAEQAFTQHKTRAQARAEAQKNHASWRAEAMKACGLSQTKPEHHELVMEGMASPRNRGKAWTKELFDAEAARVAKILGVKAPKPPKVAKPAAPPPAPPKPALPPVRAQGAAPRAPAAPPKPRSNKPKDTSSFFDRLRAGELG